MMLAPIPAKMLKLAKLLTLLRRLALGEVTEKKWKEP